MARRLGITTLDDPDKLGLALTLGGGEVRLLELTAAYAAFANGGHVVPPTVIQRVEDADGVVLWEAPDGRGERALDARVAYLITDILSDDLARIPPPRKRVESDPTGSRFAGTTTNFRDNWTVGYTRASESG